jgi:hypothetical protein
VQLTPAYLFLSHARAFARIATALSTVSNIKETTPKMAVAFLASCSVLFFSEATWAR